MGRILESGINKPHVAAYDILIVYSQRALLCHSFAALDLELHVQAFNSDVTSSGDTNKWHCCGYFNESCIRCGVVMVKGEV